MVEEAGGGGRGRGVVGAGQDSGRKKQGVGGMPKMSGSLQGGSPDYEDKSFVKSSGESKVEVAERNLGRVEAGIKCTKSAMFTLLVNSL